MIAHVPTLTPRERRAVERLVHRILDAGVPLRAALLFGSKARGDYDEGSDVDILVLADMPQDAREPVSRDIGALALDVRDQTGVAVETWVVPLEDLREGQRTPMLIDALEDSRPLWPAEMEPVRLPFTAEDAHFCASCLVRWIDAGGKIVRDALEDGDWEEAAERARDDITRLATAALLLTGDTRHRRRSSLARFEERFVEGGIVSPRVLPALRWASAAYPPDEGRGEEHPQPSPRAVRSADLGFRLAARAEAEIMPWIRERMERLDREA